MNNKNNAGIVPSSHPGMKPGVKLDEGKEQLAVLLIQFPRALAAITRCSEYGHHKYELDSDDWTNYQRVDNAEWRYRNALMRHEAYRAFEYLDESGLPHIVHKAWNALAELELHLINKQISKDDH